MIPRSFKPYFFFLFLLVAKWNFICFRSLEVNAQESSDAIHPELSYSTETESCLRVYPSEGTWLETNSPPFYQPRNCPQMIAFEKQDIINCLKDRTVFVIGHSVARQFAFATLTLLGEGSVDRNNQKAMCEKGQGSHEKVSVATLPLLCQLKFRCLSSTGI